MAAGATVSREARQSLRAYLRALLILLISSSLSAQTTSNKPQLKQRSASDAPIFKKSVRRVLVDVVVQDANGKSVSGLKAKDFSVLEDGQPQRILSFDFHGFENSSISLPSNAPALPPNTFVNIPATPERGALYVILYDLVNTGIDDQMAARQQLLRFIDRKPEGTRFAIFVNADRLFLLQGFTNDPRVLRAAINSQGPGPHLPRAFLYGANYGLGNSVRMVGILNLLAGYLEGLPGRKNVMWVSGGFPLELSPTEGEDPALVARTREGLAALARSQVALYPVDVRGVVVVNEDATLAPNRGAGGPVDDVSSNGPVIGGKSGGAVAAQKAANERLARILQARTSLNSSYAIADESGFLTGGRSFVGNNDLVTELSDAAEHGAMYYTLSYSPSKAVDDGSKRGITVKLARPGYRLFYRQFYYAYPSVTHTSEGQAVILPSEMEMPENGEPAFTSSLSTTLLDNMWHGAPLAHQLIFKVRVHAIGAPYTATPEQMKTLAKQPIYAKQLKGKKDKLLEPVQLQKYEIYYALAAHQLQPAKDSHVPLEFAAVAFDQDGWARNANFQRASDDNEAVALQLERATDPSTSRDSKVIRARQELDVPLEATSLRVAVWDTSTDHVGAVEIPLPLAPEPNPR